MSTKSKMSEKRNLHCWQDSPDHEATCMLPCDHAGPHIYTPDGDIYIEFARRAVLRWKNE